MKTDKGDEDDGPNQNAKYHAQWAYAFLRKLTAQIQLPKDSVKVCTIDATDVKNDENDRSDDANMHQDPKKQKGPKSWGKSPKVI